jgi:hypothetical protein
VDVSAGGDTTVNLLVLFSLATILWPILRERAPPVTVSLQCAHQFLLLGDQDWGEIKLAAFNYRNSLSCSKR